MTAAMRALVLRHVPEALRPALDAGLATHKLASGEVLTLSDTASRGIVATGSLALMSQYGTGAEKIIRVLDEGAPFGAISGPGDALVALAASKVLLFDRSCVTRLMPQAPGLGALLAAADREELRREQERVLMLGERKITIRLATFVLQRWRRGGDASLVDIPLSRSDLAAYLGARVESLSRSVTDLREQGCLHFLDRGRVEILSLETLQEITGLDAERIAPTGWMDDEVRPPRG
jgi:CRP-like cAMP-binding protein